MIDRFAPGSRGEASGFASWMALALSPVLVGALAILLFVGMFHGAVASLDGALTMLDGRAIDVVVRTLIIATSIGLLATILALPWGYVIGLGRSGVSSVLALLPLLLPSYLVYIAWSLLRAPGTSIGDALVGSPEWVWKLVNAAHAGLGLALWAWPIGALILATGYRRLGRDAMDAVKLEPCGLGRRWALVAREIRGSIVASVALIALVMTGSAVPLHVAQVETYAIVIWKAIAEGRTSDGLAWVALPTIAVAILGASIVLAVLRRRDESTSESARYRVGLAYPVILARTVLVVSVLVPMLLFLRQLKGWDEIERFFAIGGESLAHSAGLGLAVGTLAFLVGASSSMRSSFDARRSDGYLWLVLALVPGVIVGSSIVRVSSMGGMDWLGRTEAGVFLAHTARFGAIGWLVGLIIARGEGRTLAEARRLFGDGGVRQWARTLGARGWAGIAGIVPAVSLLSLHEIESTVIAAPAGVQPFARMMLDWLHYMRNDAMTAGAVVLLVGGGAVALFAMAMVRLGASRVTRPATANVAIVALVTLFGCDGRGVDESGRILNAAVLGEAGRGGGQFVYPRAIDAHDGRLWIVDKTARVQEMTTDGEFVQRWFMPEFDRGMPCGITHGRDGKLYVADTHEYRVSVFDLSADEPPATHSFWGSYGENEGQFIYPTDVAILYADDSRTPEWFYVSEYGGNDRISVFDASREFLFSFGEPGEPDGSGLRFRRPQSILIDESRHELIVADAGNHRIGRFTLEGEPIAWYGRSGGLAGDNPGEFSYPYGLALAPDGTLLVSEYGNSRVQRIDLETGACLGLYGTPGREPGHITAPWALAVQGGDVFVLDSANNRLQRFHLPERRRFE